MSLHHIRQGKSLTRRSCPCEFQPTAVRRTNGIFWVDSSVKLRDITDGMSNTFLIGERSAKSGAGIWPGVQSNEFPSDVVTDCSPGNEINAGFNSFSSYHTEGVNFVMSDGRAIFISEKIDPQIYRGLSTRNGGERLGEF